LKAHVLANAHAFDFAKHINLKLKALTWKTLDLIIVDAWQKNPAIFRTDSESPHLGTRHVVVCISDLRCSALSLVQCSCRAEMWMAKPQRYAFNLLATLWITDCISK
jgi:hypothetical protein